MKYFYSYRELKCKLLASSHFHFPSSSALCLQVEPGDLWERTTSLHPLSTVFPNNNTRTYGKRRKY